MDHQSYSYDQTIAATPANPHTKFAVVPVQSEYPQMEYGDGTCIPGVPYSAYRPETDGHGALPATSSSSTGIRHGALARLLA